ncbi:sigma-70 region 4 domain-containing protein [Actinomycetospora flava]|uniref:Sigma-70 region 4 domain-containing protein n=1 Tax=Actinomycetospora flava TaxID=3129232 RepID=A0ABU8MF61_9PSEU
MDGPSDRGDGLQRAQRRRDEMGAGPLGGGQPRGGAHLQPGLRLSCDEQADLDALQVNDPDEAGDLDQGEREMQRWADLATLNDLALRSFEGPKYDIFVNALAAYGYPVIRSWLRRGVIYEFCARRGRPATPTDHDRVFLSDPRPDTEAADERRELALETNARALDAFREQVLLTGAWSFEGGASLKTYYIGACLLQFPNVLSTWSTERQHRSFATTTPSDLDDFLDCTTEWDALDRTLDHDPAATVAGQLAVAAELEAMPERTREAAGRLLLLGASYAEIGADLGITERAVEALFYRYRKVAAKRQLGRRIT